MLHALWKGRKQNILLTLGLIMRAEEHRVLRVFEDFWKKALKRSHGL